MNMETAREPFEARLRRSVGRIDDPQVVADLVLHRLAERVRYYDGLGAYEWRDGRWAIKYNKPPKDRLLKLVRKLVKDAIIDIMASLYELGELDALDTLRKLSVHRRWMTNVSYEVCYRAFVKSVETREFNIVRHPSDLLQTKGFLSVANGVIDLQTGYLHKHEDKKDLFFTYSLSTQYNPSAQAPNFYKGLEISTNGNALLADYLQWALGGALTGIKDRVYWLHGSPFTHKEWLLHVLDLMLEDYAVAVHYTAFKNAYYNKGLLRKLNGKRVVYCKDYPNGAFMDTSALKDLCKHDKIPYFWYGNLEYAYSLTQAFISSSGFPSLDGNPAPFLTRVYPIMFQENRYCKILFGNKFFNAIMQEKEGILAWLVEGAKKYLADTSLENNPALQNFAMNMKEQWIEEMKKAQNKKPLPTRKGQTQNKNRL